MIPSIESLNITPIYTTKELAIKYTKGMVGSECQIKGLEKNKFLKFLAVYSNYNDVKEFKFDVDLRNEFKVLNKHNIEEFIEQNTKETKINKPYPCGSGKLFRNCHMKVK